MRPIKFNEANLVLIAPKGEEGKVADLHCFSDGQRIISCWELNENDLQEINEHKRVYIVVVGSTHPPLGALVFNPFQPTSERQQRSFREDELKKGFEVTFSPDTPEDNILDTTLIGGDVH